MQGGTGCPREVGLDLGNILSSAEHPEGTNPTSLLLGANITHNGGQIVTSEVAPWDAKAHWGHKAG